jgi:hypothetical protein
MTENESSAREAMEQSRLAVVECEEEIKSIKNALKSLTMGTTSAESTVNRLSVSVHKVATTTTTSSDNGAVPLPTAFKIHLSSPIEVRTITQLYDPLNPTAESGLATFESVEISNALLTVETYGGGDDVDGDGLKKLGVSASHDLLPLCQDMELWKNGGEKKSSSLEIAIVAEGGIDDEEVVVTTTTTDKSNESESWEDAVTELVPEEGGETEEGEEAYIGEVNENSNSDIVETKEEEKDGEGAVVEKEEETKTTTNIQIPLYTIVIQLEYTPSPEDRRDALYEKLNEVSKRKVAAIESLRKSAGMANRARGGSAVEGGGTSGDSSGNKASPAVKSGFLNKTKGGGEDKSSSAVAVVPFWKRWYENTLGPQSMLWVLGPVAKNYIIFVGVTLFIHYRGDLLALPPPV